MKHSRLFKGLAALAMLFGVGAGVILSSHKEAVETRAADSETYTLTNLTTATSVAYSGESKTYSSVAANKASGSTAPTFYTNGNAVRFYASNTLVVSAASGRNVTGISLTSSNSTLGNFSATGYSSGTWSGSASRVTFNVSAAARLTRIVVTTETASSAPTLSVDKTAVSVAVGSTATFTVTSANLTSNFSVSGGDSNYFTTSYTPASSDGEHVVTLTGIAATTSPISLTVSATGATSKTVAVSVEEPVIYEKLTSTSSLKNGSEFIIGSADGAYVLGQYVSGNNCAAYTTTPDAQGNLISTNLPSNYAYFTLGGSTGSWILQDQNSKIYYGTNNENHLKSANSSTDTWTISIASSGVATITSAASSRSIKKNSSSALFSTYASGQKDVSIYMVPTSDPSIEVTVTGESVLRVGETATLTATKLNGASGTVNWATSNSSVLSLSAATGDSVTVTAAGVGNASITASLTGCENAVTDFSVIKGGATTAYTVSEARAAIDAGHRLENAYTSGIISQVDEFKEAYGSITYRISADGLTTSPQLEVYSGLNLNSAQFDSIDDLKVGDIVTVCGTLKKFGSTYEYDKNNFLVAFERPVIELASITGIDGTLSASAGASSWDLSTLTPKGTMAGSSEVIDISLYVTLSTEDVPGTPASTTTRQVAVTVTPKDPDSGVSPATFNVTGTITVVTGVIPNGRYYITHVGAEGPDYGVSNTYGGSATKPTSVDLSAANTLGAFDFTVGEESDQFTIKSGQYYLYTTGSNDGLKIGTTSGEWTITKVTPTGEGEYDYYTLMFTSTNRYLTSYINGKTNDFRSYNFNEDYYGVSRVSNGQHGRLMLIPERSYAEEVANALLNNLTCDATGKTAPSTSQWSTIKGQYDLITIANEKAFLTGGVADEAGDTIAQALAKYDYILAKYGDTNYSNFLGRNISSSGRAKPMTHQEKTNAAVIVMASVAALAAGGMVFYKVKRKKEI